jgi:hypothetical protein
MAVGYWRLGMNVHERIAHMGRRRQELVAGRRIDARCHRVAEEE